MGSLLVLLIVLGCVAYQYFKGTFVKSFVMIIVSICAGVVAFGYFELLANVLIERKIFMLWARSLSFGMLFILAFAILQAIASQLAHKSVNLGIVPERIGRIICGVFSGLILSGLLLVTISMAPISGKYPYQRFNKAKIDPENANKVLLNADGFATGWFSIISGGSFSGKRSFATLHPAFLDQFFLNRQEIDNGISNITSSKAIEIPRKAVWPAPEGLRDMDGKLVPPKSGYNLTIVRLKFTPQAIKMDATFTPPQLRLVCKQKNGTGNKLVGKTKNVYPVGYMETADRLELKELTDRIEIKRSDYVGRTKEIDFAFYVPDGFIPVLVEFKQNCINQLPLPTPADEAPPAVPFTPPPEPAENVVESSVEDTAEDIPEDSSSE